MTEDEVTDLSLYIYQIGRIYKRRKKRKEEKRSAMKLKGRGIMGEVRRGENTTYGKGNLDVALHDITLRGCHPSNPSKF